MVPPEKQPEKIREAIQETPALSLSAAPRRADEAEIPEVRPWRSTAFFGHEVIDRWRRPWFALTLLVIGLAVTVFGGVGQAELALIIGPLLLAWGMVFSL